MCPSEPCIRRPVFPSKHEVPYEKFMKQCELEEMPITDYERGDFAIIEKSLSFTGVPVLVRGGV